MTNNNSVKPFIYSMTIITIYNKHKYSLTVKCFFFTTSYSSFYLLCFLFSSLALAPPSLCHTLPFFSHSLTNSSFPLFIFYRGYCTILVKSLLTILIGENASIFMRNRNIKNILEYCTASLQSQKQNLLSSPVHQGQLPGGDGLGKYYLFIKGCCGRYS